MTTPRRHRPPRRADDPAHPRGLEVRLVRRLPADPAQLRGRALAIAGAVDIAYFPEATRAVVEGPYDVSLVEGSITTPHDAERIHEIRAQSGVARSRSAPARPPGGIQALRNFADVEEYRSDRLRAPRVPRDLDRSTPISAHINVDFELRGCPIDKGQSLEVLAAALQGRKPRIPTYSVCVECKRRGQRVRRRRRRHAVPRPGDPGRMRRAVPVGVAAAATAASAPQDSANPRR